MIHRGRTIGNKKKRETFSYVTARSTSRAQKILRRSTESKRRERLECLYYPYGGPASTMVEMLSRSLKGARVKTVPRRVPFCITRFIRGASLARGWDAFRTGAGLVQP